MPPGRTDTDPPESLYLGIDFGTSGCRALAIGPTGEIQAQAETPIPPLRRDPNGHVAQDPRDWWRALTATLQDLFTRIDRQLIRALAVDGTSGTLLLCDALGEPLTPALLYNDRRASSQAARIATVAPAESAAHGATGGLAKLMWLIETGHAAKTVHALHQADWLAGKLTGRFGHSDYNNCLKLGYDAERLAWPDWLARLGIRKAWLPQVHAPGTPLRRVRADIARDLGLPAQAQVVVGTTDGVAAFLAAGSQTPGEGVTSLGSTLVLKLLSDRPVFSPAHGVYSHRLGRWWLAGGASNSGGAALAKFFSPEQLRTLTPKLKPDVPTGLDYYPLPATGERFPVNDPLFPPRLEPRPPDDTVFLQGMLEGIARIEAQGYALLAQLGAPKLKAVFTTGGGAQNAAWERIRARQLGVPLRHARSEQAAYGTALLAAGLAADIFGFEN